ncbi:hypothetical protein [Hymenobacter sp. UYP22]|uniref:hypothetical protein n=1 Tax=Hymenobacter sp. UYP22 TaxID=3156348 RepID=UPI0033962CA3
MIYIRITSTWLNMKHLLFAALFLPAFARAQNRLPPRVVALPPPVDVAQALSGSLNPRGLQLDKSTVLYRQLRDTVAGRPALHLQPGDAVIIRRGEYPGWLRVGRGNRKLTNFSADTATYYLPKSGAVGAKTFILL